MKSFNVYGNKTTEYGELHAPVWASSPVPRIPVGGTLSDNFLVDGLLVPAGTPVNLASKVIKPLLAYEVKAIDTGIVTIDPAIFNIVPEVGEYMILLDETSFSSNSAAAAITAVAANATDSSLLDITIALSNVAEGDFVAFGHTAADIAVPNGYLFNDIYINDVEDNIAATGAVVDQGAYILIDRIPAYGCATALKAAIPGVGQVNG